MISVWRPLALAAALFVILGGRDAAAQVVIVRGAPAGSNVELVVNEAPATSATANSVGDAILTSDLTANAGKSEIDAYIYVDVCPTVRRVLIVERGVLPQSPGEGCDRRDVADDRFVVRQISTLVIDVAGSTPTVLLRQGRFSLEPPRVWAPAPSGLVLFGGGGLGMFGRTVTLACGDVTECDGKDVRGTLAAGLAYWFGRYVAAETSYIKPGEVTVDGSAEGFRFTSVLDAELVTVGGKVGAPVGPVRMFGQIGTNYHRATFGTTQTNEDVTETIGGVTRTIPGGMQTFDLRTAGWGWQFGGGVEVWVTRAFALYAEGGRAALKGTAREGAEGLLDERVNFFLFGARIHIGK